MPLEFTHKVKTQSGYMTVANAELTALDVVAEPKKVGGLSRAAELLVELCEQTIWDESKLHLLSYFSIATIQRLGFILDIIEEHKQALTYYQDFINKKKSCLRRFVTQLLKKLIRLWSGERGIRTPGASQHDGFQDRCNRPLYHLSFEGTTALCLNCGCKGNYFFSFHQIFCNIFFISPHFLPIF